MKHNQLGGSKKAGNLLIHWKPPTWTTCRGIGFRKHQTLLAIRMTSLPWVPQPRHRQANRVSDSCMPLHHLFKEGGTLSQIKHLSVDEQKLYAHLKGSISGNKSKGPLPPALCPTNKNRARKVSSPD